MAIDNPTPSNPSLKSTRWIPSEEAQLLSLHDEQHKSFAAIAPILGRTPAACSARYHIILQRQSSEQITWTPALDSFIISGRGQGHTTKVIATGLNLPQKAVQERWVTLQQQKRVPETVLVVWRRKEEPVFTAAEDEEILRLWMQGKGDEEVVRLVGFKGKSQAEIKQRRIDLVNGPSPLYQHMLGVRGKENSAPSALKEAMGRPKYGWMK